MSRSIALPLITGFAAPAAVLRGPLVLAIALVLASCTSADPPPRWRYLHAAVIQPSCTTSGCHSTHAATAGLDLSAPDGAYALLTGRICGAPEQPIDPPGNFVVPYSVASSRLYHLLVGDNADQMPPDSPLAPDEIELIARWIEGGARCD